MRVVTLVPWRPGDPRREWCFDVTRPALERLGYEIFTGDSVGPWARAAAVNRASEAAGNWDVALVSDSDTIPEPGAIRRAVAWVADTGGGARPHGERWMLTKEGALVFAQRGPSTLKPAHFATRYVGGGLLVVARRGWEAVGGFDERFIEWGREDSVMNVNLLVKASWDRLPGNAWHLWHPTHPGKVKSTSDALYQQALRENRVAIRAWGADKGFPNPEAVL
jgi:hypothetical protein